MRERCKRIGCRVLRRVSQGTDSEHDRDRNPAGTIQTAYGPGPGGASPPEPKDLDHACSRLRSGFDKSESNLFCDTVNPRQTESSWGLISRCLRNFGVFHILGIGMDIMIQRCGRIEEPEKVHVDADSGMSAVGGTLPMPRSLRIPLKVMFLIYI